MKMRDVIIVLLLILALCGAPTAGAFAGESRGPRIHTGEGRFDFGTVAAGSLPEHTFDIKNVGDEVLEIRQVQPT